MKEKRYQILLTNDDGIQSPGLWAAAEGLAELGYVTVVAPRDQSSATGRAQPSSSDGIIQSQLLEVHGKQWTVYSVGGTPAQTVQFAVLEIMPQPPDLVVSGINYGENVGTGVTVSGTVGAALEASSLGIPGMAVSLETDIEDHFSHSTEVDFSTARYFAGYFARRMLEKRMPPDVDVLKVDVPSSATPQTPWELTRLARHRYWELLKPEREAWDQPAAVGYQVETLEKAGLARDSDIYALRFKRVVSVTPLSLDLTSRVDLSSLDGVLREE
ncbi:MAG TPA: 5'/3'-nucleotidase SurE [Anaerolineaceae bacterium]